MYFKNTFKGYMIIFIQDINLITFLICFIFFQEFILLNFFNFIIDATIFELN